MYCEYMWIYALHNFVLTLACSSRDVQLELDAKTRKAALALLCDNPFAKRMNNVPRQVARTEPWLQPPSPSLPIIYPQTPPLFPRVHAPRESKGSHIQSITDLPSVMVSMSVDSEPDMPERHMTIINGWREPFTGLPYQTLPNDIFRDRNFLKRFTVLNIIFMWQPQ